MMPVAGNNWVSGAGLGLRRGLIPQLHDLDSHAVDFMEIAPENWIHSGGRLNRQLRAFTERFDFLAHGLSLSIGGPDPLDRELVKSIKAFLQEHGIKGYSEHLSYCSAGGHLYDLMPIPMTEEAVRYVAERIGQVQDILGERLIIENVSTYAEPGKEMAEADFVRAVIDAADCDLLLDVNNVYVNAINHGDNARDFICAMPSERIRYLHIAGHFDESEQLLIDTHGAAVKDDVWSLLEFAYQQHGVRPTLLERDFNFPPLHELLAEIDSIRRFQSQYAAGGTDYSLQHRESRHALV
ncbi:HvfB family MNIO-type RiPP peptide maturase [Thalassolituus sp. LLYu03]|uniref:HvfB family MNIO-type RiPP peptide maturase n=1 Tax=Thalassolituus sp. LLYu03 TaxID=3421656 RepID=UPI003D2B52DD